MTKKNERKFELQVLRNGQDKAESYLMLSLKHAEKAREMLLRSKEIFNIKEIAIFNIKNNIGNNKK